MRTTISLSEAVLRRARQYSVQHRMSLGEVIEDALKMTLFARNKPTDCNEEPRKFKTFGDGGSQPGIDLSSNAALLDSMENR